MDILGNRQIFIQLKKDYFINNDFGGKIMTERDWDIILKCDTILRSQGIEYVSVWIYEREDSKVLSFTWLNGVPIRTIYNVIDEVIKYFNEVRFMDFDFNRLLSIEIKDKIGKIVKRALDIKEDNLLFAYDENIFRHTNFLTLSLLIEEIVKDIDLSNDINDNLIIGKLNNIIRNKDKN